MSTEPTSAGWILHSLAQGRRFGPLSEDELRNYFRAGMVKSVDRLSAPGDAALLPAAEVAALLEVPAPVGPPPPELPPVAVAVSPAATPGADAPAAAAAAKPAPVLDERAAKAIAAVQMELATRNTGRGNGESRPAWLVPVVIVVLLVATLFYALSMLRKMKPPPSDAEVGAIAASAPHAPPSLAQDPAEIAQAQAYAAAQAQASASEAGDVQQDAATRERYQRAQLLAKNDDWHGLLAHASAWTQAEPGSGQARRLLAIAHARLGDYAKSADAYNQLLLLEPGNANAKGELADVYLGAERWQEAADLYKALVAGERANDARLWNNYGMALGRTGQDAQAVAALETAVRLDPAFKQAWSNLAEVYEAAGDATRAAAARANAR